MTPSRFFRSARDLFAETLVPMGFSCERSISCTFSRLVGEGLWHVIMPDVGTKGAWYDVKVFPCCERLQARFSERFPDQLGIPTDSFCYLSERGVGLDQALFPCGTESRLRSGYESTVSRLVEGVAVPYLGQFQTLRDVLPVIRNPLQRAIATHLLKKDPESRRLLIQQRDRLLAITDDEDATATTRLLDALLAS